MAETQKTFRAVHRWARIAPRKARLVADMVRGLPVDDALAVLDNHPRRGAATGPGQFAGLVLEVPVPSAALPRNGIGPLF